jgi:hypothetical protein
MSEMTQDDARNGEPKTYPSQGVPTKIDRRALRLLKVLANWLGEYQYRVIMRLVVQEVGRTQVPVPPHLEEDLRALREELAQEIPPKGRDGLPRVSPQRRRRREE